MSTRSYIAEKIDETPIGVCIATMTATLNTTAGCCLNTTTQRSA